MDKKKNSIFPQQFSSMWHIELRRIPETSREMPTKIGESVNGDNDYDPRSHSTTVPTLLCAKKEPIEEINLLPFAKIVMHTLPTNSKTHVHLHIWIIENVTPRLILEILEEVHALKIR
ncbi:hypothetical protein RRF57_010262 [Xylaria bambusicola]|uniref:Uncharacterized protein n=1 Tax=Xylaria bambusicola TaxID=326684 RepID=A0AAN7V3G5_9PEZI